MTEFKTRSTRLFPDGPEITHTQLGEEDRVKSTWKFAKPGDTHIPSSEGDVTFTVSAGDEFFNFALSEDRGRDRDNYPDSANVEIDLNEEEAREVLLTLTVWLENRT